MFKLLTVLATVFLLVACQPEPEVEDDGTRFTYFAIENRSSHNDWQDFILIETNSQGDITSITLDGINPIISSTRRESARLGLYEEMAGYNFYEQMRAFEEELIGQPMIELTVLLEGGDAGRFEPSRWAHLAMAALSAGPLEAGPYLDGLYQSIADEEVDGFTDFVNFIVVHGHIVEVQWNAITEDGFLKYDYISRTGSTSDVRVWREQAILLEEELLRIQDPLLLTFDADGYAIDLDDVEIPIEIFVSLVVRGLAQGPTVIDLEQD